VKRGVALNDTDDRGDQAIHYAASAGSAEAIRLFISRGIAKCTAGL